MASPEQPGARELITFGAVLDHLIPRDDAPGARDLLTASQVRVRVPGFNRLLTELGDFSLHPHQEQDRMLRQLESSRDACFLALVDAVHELYYGDRRSWQGVGYVTHLPGSP